MKKVLPLIFFLLISGVLHAQKDTLALLNNQVQKNFLRETSNVNVNIYPVPVRDKNFTIRAEKNIAFVKVTNMIGQDIYRIQYNNPQQLVKVWLDNPKRGMYLVTLLFEDGTRLVRKIMVEEPE